jgi:hypothetical protein
MEPPARRPNLLHLEGITLADYVPVEDLFDAQVLEGVAREELPLDPLPFDKIPPVFTGLDDWPVSTNLHCWSCTFSFDGPPRFAPTYIREGEQGRLEVGVEGNFCTFNCAGGYVDTQYPPQAYPQKHWRMRDGLCTVYQLFTGHRVRHIPPSPAKTELRKYGGTLSEEQFWKTLRRLDEDHGLRDHRPGSVVPERVRPRAAHNGRAAWTLGAAEAPPPPLDDAAAFPALGPESGAGPGPASGSAPPAAEDPLAAEELALALGFGPSALSSAPPRPPSLPTPGGPGPA